MCISSIYEALLKTAFASTVQEHKPGKAQALRKDDLFTASMALYLSTLHQLLLESWHRFAETQKSIADDNDEVHRNREQHFSELEGQKKQMDILLQSEESEYIRCGIHRQMGKFRFYEGKNFGEGFDHRHLHLAV